MELTNTALTTITIALHDYIKNMLLKYDDMKSLIFLEEAQKGNEAYREIMGSDNPLCIRHLSLKGVPLQ